MEVRGTAVAERRRTGFQGVGDGDGELVGQRLDWFLAANAEFDRECALYRDERERVEALTMRRPLTLEQATSFFGATIASLPATALAVRWSLDVRAEPWIYGIAAVIVMLAAVIGYFTGRPAARVLRVLETMNWTPMMLLLPFFGLVWGIVTGALAGVVFFIVGGLVGGIVGGMVGAATLPAFGALHRLLRRGEMIERAQLVPVAVGLSLTVCGFLLGMR